VHLAKEMESVLVVSSVVPIGRDKSISHVFASQLAAAAVAMFGQPPVVPGIEQPAQGPDVTIRTIRSSRLKGRWWIPGQVILNLDNLHEDVPDQPIK
jgi:hypothetical protein